MLVLEDLVDGGQTDVFIHSPVAGDEVLIEQLSVIGAGRLQPADDTIPIGNERIAELIERRRGRRHIVDEGVPDAQRRLSRYVP